MVGLCFIMYSDDDGYAVSQGNLSAAACEIRGGTAYHNERDEQLMRNGERPIGASFWPLEFVSTFYTLVVLLDMC